MNATHRIRRRSGFTTFEVSIALAMLFAAAILMSQFLIASAQQRKLAAERRLALGELSNRLERVMAAKWEEVTAEAIEKPGLPAVLEKHLFAAKLTASVTDEAEPAAAKRIKLELSWEQHGQRVTPVTLTGWKFKPQE